MKIILIIIIVPFLIIVSYQIAKRRELTCPKCKAREYKKTGNKREIKRQPFVHTSTPIEYEYLCENCQHKFWSTIENIWK